LIIFKKTIRRGSGGGIPTDISDGASRLQMFKKASHRYKTGNESVSHHLLTSRITMILLSLLPGRFLLSRPVGFADRSIKPPKGYKSPVEASCGHFRTSFIMIYYPSKVNMRKRS